MELFNFSNEEFERFLYVFFRVSAFFIFVPIIGSRQFPVRMKIGLALLLSFMTFPLISGLPLPQPKGALDLSVYLFAETLVGLTLAFAMRMIFVAVQVAGTVVDFQMGFGVVNVIDPQTETQVSITAQFQNIFAILIYLALNAHHLTIYSIVESFQLINPMQFNFTEITMGFILKMFATTFMVAVKIAAPIMAILFLISVGLGLVARTVPQMNVFIVGFPLQIGVGLIMIGLTMTYFSMAVKQQIADLPFWLVGLMRTL